MGSCYVSQKNLTLAAESYEKALSYEPELYDARYHYAMLSIQEGNFDTAKTQLELILKKQPNHIPSTNLMGQIYLQQGEAEKAIAQFDKLIQHEAADGDTFHDLGQAFLLNHQPEDAVISLEQAIVLESKTDDCNHLLGNAFIMQGDYEKALNYFLRQIELAPMPESYYNIGVLLMYQERNKEAIEYLKQAAELDPTYLPTHLNLGSIYLKLNRMNDAIAQYKKANELKPDDPEIKHILNALNQEQTPDAAPKEYLQHLFDQYATYYDQHLTQHLKYDVPKKLFDAIDLELSGKDQLTILDLGCGTGLCAPYFRLIAEKLIGVDISEQMVATAKQKELYDELLVDDIHDAISKFNNIDIVIAADVFTYIGKLDDLFKKIHSVLNESGLFAFSVEKTNTEPYELHQSIRYAHSRAYLEKVIQDAGFDIVNFDNLILREQKKKPVEGYLIVLSLPEYNI